MREQLLLLLELQEIDSRVHELRTKINALPEELAPARQDLTKLETMLQGEKDQLAETEAWRKEQESLIQLEEEAIKKAKAKVQAAKSTKDYSAASRELDNKRKSKSDREDELLKVMEALEKSRADMESHEKDINSLREQLSAQEELMKAQIAQLGAEAEERSAGREDIVIKIKPNLLDRYLRVMKKRGYALVAVIDGVCQGCNMRIPPQLNNTLARFDSVELCRGCHRLLYRQDCLDEAGEAES